jgi:two-component system response regulator HydG
MHNAGDKSHCRVCLLDDDPSVLKATKRLLVSVGWKVEAFTHPASFLHFVRSNVCTVAVLDVLMPLMSGLEVQAQLRDISPSTPVIILTSSDDPSVRSRALDAGALAVFVKPADDEAFLTQIQAAVDLNHLK